MGRIRAPNSIPRGRSEAVLVPADPPRTSTLALWHPSGTPTWPAPVGRRGPVPRPGAVDLVLPTSPTNTTVRTRSVEALLVPISEVIHWVSTFAPGNDTSATLAAWMTAAHLGLDLMARGRLLPGLSPGGFDQWRVGPLDLDDDERLAALVGRFPPQAHALAVPRTRPLRIHDAEDDIRWFWDALADTMVRTAAAPMAATSPGGAFTGAEPVAVADHAPWLDAVAHGLVHHDGEGARPILRLELPEDDNTPMRASLQLRSHRDPSLIIDAEDLWDSPDVVLSRLGEQAETDLLLALRRGAAVWSPLARVLDDARPTSIEIDNEEAAALVGSVSEDLASAGFDVLWPIELAHANRVRVRASISTPAPAAVAAGGIDLSSLLQFTWKASLGDEELTEAELHLLAEAKRPLVRLRGRWVAADPKLAERLSRPPRKVRGGDALAAALAGTLLVDEDEEVEVVLDAPLTLLADRLRALDSQREMTEPPGLDATLRPYQRRGLAWLVEMSDLGLGGVLADDMGLGKTIQLIALHLHRRDTHPAPTLVVCPTSLLGNWQRELRRFAPSVPVRRYHGGDRHLDDLAYDEVVLVTYGVVRRDRAALAEVTWGLVVADEAQHVKNPLARTARELRLIPAPARLALTGTPIENRLTELWSLLDWTTPGLLGSLDHFRRTVAVPVERHRDPEATERFAHLVRPFLLRRRKIDPGIAPELPPKTETDVIVPLTTEQATLYQAVVRETMDAIEKAEGIARRGLVLKLLTGLKQVTNHPAQYLNQLGPIEGRSGKLAALDELLDVIVDAGDSVLLFTQYVAMGRLLERHLADRGIDTLFLHGQVPVARREEMVDRFQEGEVPVFILSLKAGGTGLNLTQATHVVHYDRWWNPAVEDQATDRAYRIGQRQSVQVHRLISEGTVEDRIAQLLTRKRDLADAVVGTGEGWIGDLDDAELAELVTLSGDDG